jgi:hypothetical protein
MEIQKVPEMLERPETGPMQFGDDWPGVFIRGDNALLGYYPAVRQAMELLPDEHWIAKAGLRGLADLLQSCNLAR